MVNPSSNLRVQTEFEPKPKILKSHISWSSNFCVDINKSQGLTLIYTATSHNPMTLHYLYLWKMSKLTQNLRIWVQLTCMEEFYHICNQSDWSLLLAITLLYKQTTFSITSFFFLLLCFYIVVGDIFCKGQFNNRNDTQTG